MGRRVTSESLVRMAFRMMRDVMSNRIKVSPSQLAAARTVITILAPRLDQRGQEALRIEYVKPEWRTGDVAIQHSLQRVVKRRLINSIAQAATDECAVYTEERSRSEGTGNPETSPQIDQDNISVPLDTDLLVPPPEGDKMGDGRAE